MNWRNTAGRYCIGSGCSGLCRSIGFTKGNLGKVDFLEVLGQSTENSAVAFLNEIVKPAWILLKTTSMSSGAAASAAVDVIVQPFVAIVEGIQLVTGPVVLISASNIEAHWRSSPSC